MTVAGINVGSVSVTVVPDAERFASTLSAKVGPAAQQVGDDIGRVIGDRIAQRVRQALGDAVGAGAAQARPAATAAGDSTGGAFADGFRRRVEAALRALPDVTIGADSSDADRKIADIRARLDELSTKRVGVDIDAATALAELDRLTAKLDEVGAKSPNAQVRVDTAAARTELAEVQAQLDRIDGRTARAKVVIDQVSGMGGGGFSPILDSALAFGPAVGAAALGGLGVLPAALAGIGGGAAALKLGLGGVGTTLTDMTQAQAQAGTAAAQTAQRIASADQAVVSTQRSLDNARRTSAQQAVANAEQVSRAQEQLGVVEENVAAQRQAAARQVQSAEYSLAQAEQASTQAQQALNDARQTAARQLQDMANSAKDANLQVQQDRFNLVDAQRQQQQIDASSTATAEDKAKAALAVAQAQQALKEAMLSSSRATSDNAAAQKAGVDGSKQVQQATQQVAAAQHNQAQAQQALTDAQAAQVKAQKDGARQIADAERAIADARRNEANAAANSAASIAAAQQSLADAEEKRKVAAQTASSAASKVAQDMAKLTPAGRAFVEFLKGLSPELTKLKAAAQGNLLPGLTTAIKELLPAAPAYRAFIGAVAGDIGRFAEGLAKVAASPAAKAVLQAAAGFMRDIAEAAPKVLDGLTRIGAAFAPIVARLGSGIDSLAGKFDAWAQGLAGSSGFQKFLDYVEKVGPSLVDTLGKVGGAIINVVKSLAPFSAAMLPVIGAIADLVKNNAGLAAFGLIAWRTAGLVGMFGKAMGVLVDNPWLIAIAALGLAAYELYKHWDTVAKWFSGPFVDFFIHAWDDIKGAFFDAVHWVEGFFTDHWKLILAIISGPIALAVYEVVTHWNDIRGAFSDAWQWVSSTFAKLWAGAEHLLASPLQRAKSVLDDVWNGIRDAASSLWDDVQNIFVDGVNTVIDGINWFIKGIDKVLGLIPGVHLHIGLIPDLQVTPPGQHHAGLRYAANGMVLPGYAPGVDSIPAMLSPGESVLRPEVTRWLGPATIDSWNHAAAHGGIPGFAFGISDIFGAIGHAVGSAVSGAENLARGFAAKGAGWAINAAEAPARAVLDHLPAGMIRTVAMGVLKALHDDIVGFIAGRGSAPGPVGAPVSRWAADVAKVAQMLGITTAVVPGVLSLISHESGGNPNAINLWDSNAAAGHPSQGLMQTIPSTFEAYRSRALPDSITDPMANIYAGMHYALANYGLGMLMAGGRHDAQGNYVGYDSGGWLPPGPSLVYNGTGSPEPVFTRHQWDQIGQAARGGDGAAVAVDMSAVVDELAALRAEVRSLPKEHARIVRSR